MSNKEKPEGFEIDLYKDSSHPYNKPEEPHNVPVFQAAGGLYPPQKNCKFCKEKINEDAVLCVYCGRQVEELRPAKAGPNQKFCKFCGQKINEDAVLCVHCGRQVEEFKSNSRHAADQPVVTVINNNSNVNHVMGGRQARDKWVAFLLCFFLGGLGVHKFYEGNIVMGVIYLLTGGLFGIGWLIDIFVILLRPNPYYV